MPVPSAAIHVWLEHTPNLDTDPTTRSRKRKRLAEIDLNANAALQPTMPGDATTKHSVKRQQAGVARGSDNDDDNFDSDGGQPTPRPRARRAAEATAAGYDTGGTGRAKSPIKTMADLSIAAKPPRLCSGREAPVPDDVRQLHAQLDLIQTGEALILADVKDFFHGPNSQLRDWQIDTNPFAEKREHEAASAPGDVRHPVHGDRVAYVQN
ncbi:hypothetical protein DL765_009163 [Monosporascus sp. GIB2]|nr:hypothetical protein DL765_009163 [Monosporascus sp. GIB2]